MFFSRKIKEIKKHTVKFCDFELLLKIIKFVAYVYLCIRKWNQT